MRSAFNASTIFCDDCISDFLYVAPTLRQVEVLGCPDLHHCVSSMAQTLAVREQRVYGLASLCDICHF